jgi:hypothetical protein
MSSCSVTNECDLLCDKQGHPSGPLLSLLSELQVEHNGTFGDIVRVTQKNFLRPANKERWEVPDQFGHKRVQLKPLFDALGLVTEVKPSQKKYDYVLFLGASYPAVKKRLEYIVSLWDSGIRFKKIIILTGQRFINEERESLSVICTDLQIIPDNFVGAVPLKTETDMIRFVFAHMTLPEGLKQVPVEYVDTPQGKDEHGALVRPTTADTVIAWRALNPAPGRCLIVSTQPHIHYQHAIIQSLLPKNFDLETVGDSLGYQSCNISIVLDALARWIFVQEKLRNGR